MPFVILNIIIITGYQFCVIQFHCDFVICNLFIILCLALTVVPVCWSKTFVKLNALACTKLYCLVTEARVC